MANNKPNDVRNSSTSEILEGKPQRNTARTFELWSRPES